MSVSSLPRVRWLKKSEIFALFFVLEAMVVAILPISTRSGWTAAFLPVHAGITAALLAASWLAYKNERTQENWPVFYVLFCIGMAILVSTLWHMDLTRLFGYPPGSPQETSLAIFFQSLLRVVVALVLMAVVGFSWQSIYLQKGNLGLGLAAGFSGFLILAAIAFIPLAGQAGTANKLINLLPWILLFVLSNGFAEELLFRGLLLKRYEPFLGKGLANLLAAVVFTLLHFQVSYVPDVNLFLLGTFPLALLWGALMQKTDSLWGPALFHAGADCLIIFGIYASI